MNFDDCEMKEKKRGKKEKKELDHLVTLPTYLLVFLQVF
jgi:hypothetical protein